MERQLYICRGQTTLLVKHSMAQTDLNFMLKPLTGLHAHDMFFTFFTFLIEVFKSPVFNSFTNAIVIFNKCGKL